MEDLREFLEQAELAQYHRLFRENLKVTKVSQLRFVTTEDLAQIGLSKPEQRRYKNAYNKHFPSRAFLMMKKFLHPNKKRNPHGKRPSSVELELQTLSEFNAKIPTKYIISVDDITINEELGMGQFGVVQQGIWNTGYQRLQVAIKCLGHEQLNSNSTEFLKEAVVMHGIDHPNIVRLFGVVFHLNTLMLVTELAPLRSLLECLREVSLRTEFTVSTLCDFAEQICDGMAYLERKRLIHRDLAARNILVFSKECVKISDFGLSRALGVGKDYYQSYYTANLKLPVAWCAPESILYLKFTSASDVWAFGVCLWEMFTYGFQPWAAYSGHHILKAIDAPKCQRLEKPPCCPEGYYAVMKECWSHDPKDRPKFKNLILKLRAVSPEQVQTTSSYHKPEDGRRRNCLEYEPGQIITVLGKGAMTKCSLWYGVIPGGACGVFDPANTKPYVKPIRTSFINHQESPPLSGSLSTSMRSCLLRSDVKRHTYTGKGNIQRTMISSPQGEVKHTGHVGLDGAFFGDVSFLDPAGCPPRHAVAPYKPSEDLEQMPLINPNSPSHLSGGASSTPPYPVLTQGGSQNLPRDTIARHYRGNARRPVIKPLAVPTASKSFMNRMKSATLGRSHKSNNASKTEGVHEYHEISDTDTEGNVEHFKVDIVVSPGSPGTANKYRDFSQGLVEDMQTMMRSFNPDETQGDVPQGFDNYVRTQTLIKIESRKTHHNSDTGTMKKMSAHDMKTLDTAVALANEITNRTMNDLDTDYGKAPKPPTDKNKNIKRNPASNSQQPANHPEARELTAWLHYNTENGNAVNIVVNKQTPHKQERRNFSEEAKSVPDLQATITAESKMAYLSLIEEPSASSSLISQIAQGAKEMQKHSTIPKSRLKPGDDAQFNSLRKQQARSGTLGEAIKPGASSDSSRDQAKDEAPNALPLPPRSSNTTMVEKARHVRKYPLVLQEEPPAVCRTSKNNYENSKSTGVVYQNYMPCHIEASRVAEQRYRNDQKVQYQNLASVDVYDGATPSTSGTQVVTTNPFKNGTGVNPFELYMEKELGDESDEGDEGAEGDAGEEGAAAAAVGDVGPMAQEPTKENEFQGSLVKDCTDHVSVEDLLEFADLKPCGRQRGTESDEVRIICKVLKDQVVPEECLEALDLCNWNVYIAIKIMRVKCAVGGAVDLPSCAGALQEASGDVVKAFADLIHPQHN